MLELLSEPTLVAAIGLAGGIGLGLAARLGRFCTLGAIEDLYYGDSALRLRMWGVAIGVAVIATYWAAALGYLDLSQTLFLARFWNPFASIVGGLLFGYGMAMAGNCGYGALARLGGGDLRSFVIVVIMGLFAYITLGGPLSAIRQAMFGDNAAAIPSQDFATLLATPLSTTVERMGILIGFGILVFTLANKELRESPSHIVWGAVVGLAVASGWIGTYLVNSNGFSDLPVVSHTFSAPIGETMLYVMTSSGNAVSFGTGSVAGVLLGAFLGSLIKGHFRWEACEDPRELRRQMLGAALMGIGAVIAVGCSVGQGLSAFSVLAVSAPVTLGAIMVGAAIGLRQMIVGFSSSI